MKSHLQGTYTEEKFYPIERMLECLSIYCGNDKNGNPEDILEVELYQLKIQIDIGWW